MLKTLVARVLMAVVLVTPVVMMFGPVMPPGVSWT